MTVTGPAHRAHYRLLQAGLPARTHIRPEPVARCHWAPDCSAEGLRLARKARMDGALETQRQVLALAAQGLRNIEIVELLGLSSATVSRHRRGEGLAVYRR